MLKLRGLHGLGLALAVLLSPPAHGAAAPCDTAVTEQLKQLNTDPADVAGITYLPRAVSRRSGYRIVGYDAWVNLKSCQGAIIVAMSSRCRVQQVYTRNNCKLPGIPSY